LQEKSLLEQQERLVSEVEYHLRMLTRHVPDFAYAIVRETQIADDPDNHRVGNLNGAIYDRLKRNLDADVQKDGDTISIQKGEIKLLLDLNPPGWPAVKTSELYYMPE